MIKTECKRSLVDNNILPPENVQIAFDEFNSQNPFEIIVLFDIDSDTWQFYNVKSHGATKGDDMIHWQISAPTKGRYITPGIIDWLKKYDTSQRGFLDKDDLKKKWLNHFKEHQYKQINIKYKKEQEDKYVRNWSILKKLSGLREQIAVPIQVGYNKRTGKKILAVKKRRRALNG